MAGTETDYTLDLALKMLVSMLHDEEHPQRLTSCMRSMTLRSVNGCCTAARPLLGYMVHYWPTFLALSTEDEARITVVDLLPFALAYFAALDALQLLP